MRPRDLPAAGRRQSATGRPRGATAPHAARPVLRMRSMRPATEDEYRLFWSLSFAVTAELGRVRAASTRVTKATAARTPTSRSPWPRRRNAARVGGRRPRLPSAPRHVLPAVAASRRHPPQRRTLRRAVGRVADDRVARRVRTAGVVAVGATFPLGVPRADGPEKLVGQQGVVGGYRGPARIGPRSTAGERVFGVRSRVPANDPTMALDQVSRDPPAAPSDSRGRYSEVIEPAP